MKKMIGSIGIIILSTWMISTAHCDELSRQKYEAAHAAYQLELSARLLEQTVSSYSPITNPNGAATVLTAFDQLANNFVQAGIPIGNYLKFVIQTKPEYSADAQKQLINLGQAIQSVSMLQTISRGASSASLSSYSYLTDISNVVSYAGAITYASTVIANLNEFGITYDELESVQHIIIGKIQEAAFMAIKEKAGDSSVIANSDACLAAAGEIASFAATIEGAIKMAMPQYQYQSKDFSDEFSKSIEQIINDPNKNQLSFERQQQIYATAFNAIFADVFSALLNQSALQPYLNSINQYKQKTNTTFLIEIATELAEKVSEMIMPDKSKNIVDAMNYASLLNSGLLDQRHFELKDLIFILKDLSGNIQ